MDEKVEQQSRETKEAIHQPPCDDRRNPCEMDVQEGQERMQGSPTQFDPRDRRNMPRE